MRMQLGVSSLHADANPHYGTGKGATIYRFTSDNKKTIVICDENLLKRLGLYSSRLNTCAIEIHWLIAYRGPTNKKRKTYAKQIST